MHAVQREDAAVCYLLFILFILLRVYVKGAIFVFSFRSEVSVRG